MQYVIMQNNRVIWGIRDWNYRSIESCLSADCDIITQVPIDEPQTKIVISSDVVIYPATYEYPEINSKIESLAGPYWSVVNDIAIGAFNVVPKPIADVKGDLKKIIAANRYLNEIKDIHLTVQGTNIIIEADRPNKMMIIQIASLMSDVDVYNFKFPKSNNWLPMTKLDMGILINAIVAQTQTAFNWEQSKCDEIDACTTLNQLNLINLEVV